jgi:hypothetical protein
MPQDGNEASREYDQFHGVARRAPVMGPREARFREREMDFQKGRGRG